MATQNLNLNQLQTAIVSAGRTDTYFPTNGDHFTAVYPLLSAVDFNTHRQQYLDLEDQIHDTITSGFTVHGRDENNAIVNIDDDPSHPLPPIKH